MTWRRRLALLLATVMLVVMAAGPAWAKQGPNPGQGDHIGDGNFKHPDNGKQTGKGGGQLNNPHLGF